MEGTSNASDSYKSIQRFFAEQSRISSIIPVDRVDLTSCAIHSILRPYQEETVRWMVMRETKPQQLQLGQWRIDLPSGGILADEMGLGKTVEVLACILSNEKIKEVKDEKDILRKPSSKSPFNIIVRKRSASDLPKNNFLRKKPHLSDIKQNAALKYEIKKLLDEYYSEFARKVLNKLEGDFSKKFWEHIESCFGVLLLNGYYNAVKSTFAKLQTWAYLVSVYDVHELDSVGHLILLKDCPEEEGNLAVNDILPDEDATTILHCVRNYLIPKLMRKFEKEFFLKMRYCINTAGSEFIPLLEDDNVKCCCGSDKAKGPKIRCCKCESFQHLKCVGITEDVKESRYYCPSCWMNEPLVETAATLIVVPSTLTQQWFNEVQKHAADCNLKVYWYKGVSETYILPSFLASYNIVLVNFQTLRNDLSFTSSQARNLRHVKRYQSFITPLTCVKWWRLCIDEAQTVESVNKVSEMVALLKTNHLWAVTGTPVGKSLHDLYGLCTFLRMKPFLDDGGCWNELVAGEQRLLHELFAHLMRRRTKLEIGDQCALPELLVKTTWLSLSPIEGFFYNSTHVACEKIFRQKINNITDLNQPLKKANRKTVDTVLSPLLSLRQACVNPMAVGNSNQFNLRKSETMKELLVKMIHKTKVDCEDILRLYIMLVNGSARLNILAGKYTDAVALYRSILTKTNIYSDLKPDNFQMIHIMHNLYESSIKDPIIILTEDERKFPEKIYELEQKCLDRLQEDLTIMKEVLPKNNSEMSNYMNSYELKHFNWWDKMINEFPYEDVVLRVKEALDRDNIGVTKQFNLKFSSENRLRASLKYWLADVESKRILTLEFLDQITNVTSREALWSAANKCHIRKDEPKKSCVICRMESIMLKYEDLLFNISKNEKKEINWKPNPFEYVLDVLLSHSRSTYGTTIDNTNAAHQVKIFGLLRKEFRAVRAIWTKQCDLLHIFDEVRMAKSTVDPNNLNSEIFKYENTVFQNQINAYQADSASTYLKLQSKYGTLQYLKNLETKYTNEGTVSEACSVCHMSVDEKRAVMICGHFTCYGCMQELLKRYHRDNIQCPICRRSVPLSSITYIHGGAISDVDTSNVEGNYSVKVLAITAKVIELIKQDPEVKILIFSTWERALDVLKRSFNQNKITFQRYTTGNRGRMLSLASFKNKKNMNVLLMPLRSGSKGLNITEASHVIFTEPVLQLADENQAIGRIYRLGQSKNMVVHKFIIKSTVEEPLHRMTEELINNSSGTELTFRHLRDLFEVSNNLNQC